MYAVDRTHRKREDLDWVPPQIRRMRWMTAGAIWASVGGVAVGSIVLAPWAVAVYAKLMTLFLVGGLAGGRAGQRAVRRGVLRLARGDVELARVQGESDGELLVVRGRVRAETVLKGVLHQREAVYRRLCFRARGEHLVHEAAVDFSLVDAHGERIAVQAYGARLVIAPIDPLDYPGHVFAEDRLSPSLAAVVAERGLRTQATVPATEQLVRVGDSVQIVGYKARTVDPTVPALARDTPMRAALRSGRVLPLIIYKEEPAGTT